VVLALARAFGIFAIAAVALFCLMDGLGDIRKGYTASLPTMMRRPSNPTTRHERPVSFWIGVGMKLSCAAAAFGFVAVCFVVAIFSR
jgi:hypothetical protein